MWNLDKDYSDINAVVVYMTTEREASVAAAKALGTASTGPHSGNDGSGDGSATTVGLSSTSTAFNGNNAVDGSKSSTAATIVAEKSFTVDITNSLTDTVSIFQNCLVI